MNILYLWLVLSGLIFSNQRGTTPVSELSQDSGRHLLHEWVGGSENHQDSLMISYVGNMGVMLESGTKTVLIDGLHQYYKPAYQHPTKSMVQQLINGQYLDFSSIEISLVSHHHRDHFSAGLNWDYLMTNPRGLVMGSSQIREALLSDPDSLNVADRVKLAPYELEVQQVVHEGIVIKSIRCDHVNPPRHSTVKNIAYVIELNGYTIFHPGDSDWGLAERSINELRLDRLELDVMILPFWMMNQKSKSVINKINPKKVIAVHLDPGYVEEVVQRVARDYPNGHVFHELGDGFEMSE